MTIAKLHKHLGALITAGHGRKEACIDIDRVSHSLLRNGVTIVPVTGVELNTHPMADDDGGTKCRKDGTECQRTGVIIVAEC